MKVKIFVINEVGGCFMGNEEELCKAYCQRYGYTYRVEYVTEVWLYESCRAYDSSELTSQPFGGTALN